MDSYNLVNASADWRFGEEEQYSVKVWGRNLSDEFVFNQISNQVPITDMIDGGAGRTYGISLGMTF
jgi:outer membrane receptor protein involved in Fe transport